MAPPRRPLKQPMVDPLPGQRARGALLGLAVGDATGAPFQGRVLMPPPFPQLAVGPHRGWEGPLAAPDRGLTTDDTQMACCLAASLKAHGRYQAEDLSQRYLAWHAFTPGAGALTAEVLADMKINRPALQAARRVWLRRTQKPAGNGSLMRCAPIGVFFAQDPQARMQAALADSALTHFDPRCQLACAAFTASIAAAIQGGPHLKKESLMAAARSGLTSAAAWLGRQLSEQVREVSEAVDQLKADLTLAEQDDPKLYGPEIHLRHQAGFVRAAFRLAYWELLHAPSWEAALVDVINRGGDTDTHGAITGALLGAFYGEEGLPTAWKEATLAPHPRKTRPQPEWELYHPRVLLSLAPYLSR